MKHQLCFPDRSSWCTACLCCDYVSEDHGWHIRVRLMLSWVLNSSSDSPRQIASRASSPCVCPSACLAQKLSSNEWALLFSALQVAYLNILVSWFSLLGNSEQNPPSISSTYPAAWVFDMNIICVLLLFYPSSSFPEFYLPYWWLPCYIHLIKKDCLKPLLEWSLINK